MNFERNTEEAFNFYRQVFGTEFTGEIQRMGNEPAQPGQPPLADADRNLVLHVALPILGGHILMGTDAPESMGFHLAKGNNMHINLEPGSRWDADRLFKGLSDGGEVSMLLQEMFWGDYFGSCTDKFGINWMINYTSKV